MFYFWNICYISDSSGATSKRYIPFDWKFNFKSSGVQIFDIWNKRLRKNLKITIWKFKFRSIFEISHIYDSHAWNSKIFVRLNKMWYIYDPLKISLSITHIMSHIVNSKLMNKLNHFLSALMTHFYESSIMKFSVDHYYIIFCSI